jgi:hypothetical protein
MQYKHNIHTLSGKYNIYFCSKLQWKLCFVLFVFNLCALYYRYHWIVHFWLPLRYSLTFIYQSLNFSSCSYIVRSNKIYIYQQFTYIVYVNNIFLFLHIKMWITACHIEHVGTNEYLRIKIILKFISIVLYVKIQSFHWFRLG